MLPLKALATYLQQLNNLQADLARLASSSDGAHAANLYASKVLSDDTINNPLFQCALQVDNIVNAIKNSSLQAALKNFFLTPIYASWAIILDAASQDLDNQWQRTIMPIYQNSIAGYFPFAHSNTDASPDNVANFLRPNTGVNYGNLSIFNLAPYLIADGDSWLPRTWLNLGMKFNPEFLTTLSRAKKITAVLFSHDTMRMAIAGQIYPIPTPGLEQIRLETSTSSMAYHNGPQEWVDFDWQMAASTETSAAKLTTVAAKQKGVNTLSTSGPWALWHLLSHAQLNRSSSTLQAMWRVRITGDSYPVTVLIRTGKVNIFTEMLIAPWVLPQVIVTTCQLFTPL